MIFYRLALVTCLFFLTGGLHSWGLQNISYGPYNGSFIPAGLGLRKPLPTEDSPVQPTQSWTIYCWVNGDNPVKTSSLVAGFGEPKGDRGTQRYLGLHEGRFSFWSGNREVMTDASVAPGRWQMLAATFEDGNLTLYSDGRQVASTRLELLTAATVIYLAPTTSPWPDAAHFSGKIANLTLVGRALSDEEIRALMSQGKRLDTLLYEAASKTWPVQTRGQDGLRAPQEPATLPKSLAEPQKGTPRAPVNNSPALVPKGAKEWTLSGGWRLLEAPKTEASGADISRPGFNTRGWLDATVPGTVLTTMIERGVYPDPDFGLNNLAIPETLNKQGYWYRTEFTPPASLTAERFTITFQGINYRARVWLNGKALGEIKGAFTRGEFDASALLIPGAPNALAVRVEPPPHPGIPHEQSIMAGPGPNGGAMCLDGPTFICTEGWDWIPAVRDRATGIWQEVTLKATGAVRIGDVQVVTRLPLPDTTRAAVTLNVPLKNGSSRPVAGILEAAFEGVKIRRPVIVKPGEMEVTLSPAEVKQLNIDRPRLWWPNGYGSPELYHLRVSFTTIAGESDSKALRFGIRELSYELTLMDNTGNLRRVEFNPTTASTAGQRVVNVTHEGMIESVEGWVASLLPGAEQSAAIRELTDRRASPHLVIRVNGVRIAIKGGNWGLDDSRKRVSRERLEPYFRLHRDAHLTMIRNWCGQNTEEVFYELADEYGLLVWNDFWLSTQDFDLEPDDPQLFLSNAREVIRRFRNHPSIAVWCGRNEGVPPPIINEGLDEEVRRLDGTRYYIPNSRKVNLQDSGPWHYGDAETFYTRRGLGFSTEIGLPSPPSIETMRAMLPEPDHWPPSDAWAYHDWHSKGGAEVVPFVTALEEELGAPASLEDFERKAQLMNYASHRAMFEGFNARLWNPNTGRLMWMTHPAWPSMVWQMYSSDYATYGAFYGIKKACEPLHVQLNLPGLEAAVINNTTTAFRNLRVKARVFSINGEELGNQEEGLSVAAGEAAESFKLKLPDQAATNVVFIKLLLRDERGEVLSENFYWYAAEKTGYRKLNDMAAANVECSARQGIEVEASRVEVDLVNRGPGIALASEVTLRKQDGSRVLPVYASDNFVALLPGERRRISLEFPRTLSNGRLQVSLTGWNVRGMTVPVR
jgi:beta-galactosidase/beta-glucuronidase